MASLVLSDSSQLTALKSYQTKLCIPTSNHMICKNMCLAAVTSDSQNLGMWRGVLHNVDSEESNERRKRDTFVDEEVASPTSGYVGCRRAITPSVHLFGINDNLPDLIF
uniref:Uncharacterized protein n=1 Tax=Timema poppense TaxID=170557 RepID=A0A7R9CN73_TIMPO|nr:unnamed protein product [Timema poppensis]